MERLAEIFREKTKDLLPITGPIDVIVGKSDIPLPPPLCYPSIAYRFNKNGKQYGSFFRFDEELTLKCDDKRNELVDEVVCHLTSLLYSIAPFECELHKRRFEI